MVEITISVHQLVDYIHNIYIVSYIFFVLMSYIWSFMALAFDQDPRARNNPIRSLRRLHRRQSANTSPPRGRWRGNGAAISMTNNVLEEIWNKKRWFFSMDLMYLWLIMDIWIIMYLWFFNMDLMRNYDKTWLKNDGELKHDTCFLQPIWTWECNLTWDQTALSSYGNQFANTFYTYKSMIASWFTRQDM